ncbi:MAG: TldD/PmbA family protein [Bacteroidales bacterium]|nr:TldD/PmbA family protein [Bacteroidales bacterium]
MMEEERKIVADALQMALDAGVDAARMCIEATRENSVTVLDGRVDGIMSASSRALYMQLFVDSHYGSFNTNRLDYGDLRDFIRKAAESTSMVAKDKCRTLPRRELCYVGDAASELEQHDPLLEQMDIDERIRLARDCAEEVLGHPKLISVETEWGDSTEYDYIADTEGLSASSLRSVCTLSANCTIRGRGDEKPEGGWFDSDVYIDKVQTEGIGAKALERTLDSLGARRTRSGDWPLIVENTCSSQLVHPLISVLTGAALQQDNSFLKDHISEQLFPETVNIWDRPRTRHNYGSRCYDDEGLATRDRAVIDHGRIATCFINTYYGNKLGMDVTVEGPALLRFEKDNDIAKKPLTLQDMMKELDKGILITGFNGGNFNPNTGDFSYGVRGFLFEGGRKVRPVNGMNVTGNFIRLWQGFLLAGDDALKSNRWRIPSLAFSGLSFSGE